MSGPAWSGAFDADHLSGVPALPLPAPTREWAWGGATGHGVKVAVIDSGVDGAHPRVGGLAGSVSIQAQSDGETAAVEGPHEDLVGHGTACAAIIRMLAPEAEIYSIRVLGANLRGRGSTFHAGIRWALDAGMQVVNMSLSSKSDQWFGPLHEIADEAYFRNIMLVCAANNVPGPTYPSQYSSVLSVAARPGEDPYAIAYNPKHKWYWLPRQAREEALVFKVYDSEKDGRARWTAHTAFDDPTTPPNARPRESIEIRTLAFF